MDLRRHMGWVVAAGGALAILGSFLPWVEVRSIFGSLTAHGMDRDGLFTAILGGVLVILGLVAVDRASKARPAFGIAVGAVLVGLGVLVIGVVDFIDVANNADLVEAEASGFVDASQGIGLYVVIGSGIVAMIGAMRLPTTRTELVPTGSPESDAHREPGLSEELQRLSQLHEAGALTDQEYQAAKKRAIGE